MSSRFFSLFAGTIFLVSVLCGPVIAQETPTALVTPPSETARISEELSRIQSQLRTSETDLLGRSQEGTTRPHSAAKEVEVLAATAAVLEQRLVGAQEMEKNADEEKMLSDELVDLRAGRAARTEEDPFVASERFRSELIALSERAKARERSQQDLSEAVARAQNELQERESARRRLKEQVTPAPASNDDVLHPELALAELMSRYARETLDLAELQLRKSRQEGVLLELRRSLLKERIKSLGSGSLLTAERLQERYDRLQKRESAIARDLEGARLDLAAAERRFAQVRERLELLPEPDPLVSAELDAKRALLESAQRRVTSLSEGVALIQSERDVWKKRYSIASGPPSQRDLKRWREDLISARERSAEEARSRLLREDEAKKAISAASDLLATGSMSPEQARWVRERQKAYEKLMEFLAEDRRRAESFATLQQKMEDEIVDRLSVFRPWDLILDVRDWLLSVWRYELFATADDYPITVGKILLGFALIVLGWFASRALAAYFARRVLSRLRLSKGAIAALQSFIFYLFVVVCSLIAMRLINVPLTVFTFIGGALAIGVGFGSQNIVNNFISGLIVLVEGRVRVGDVIEADGISGVVSEIGTRSTRIRRSDHTDLIVPNSFLLDKNVSNWTLSDSRLRISVVFALPHSVEPDEVIGCLRSVSRGHSKVLAHPEPMVLLNDITPAVFVFELLFWIHVGSPIDGKIVASDVRRAAEAVFKDRGIPLAGAPNREFVVRSGDPLEVTVSRGSKG